MSQIDVKKSEVCEETRTYLESEKCKICGVEKDLVAFKEKIICQECIDFIKELG